MLLEIILALLIGILAGILTGLTPGIHINLISAIILGSTTGILLNINYIYLIVFIVSMSITHSFLDFIPSIFLGCPDTETELSVLPGHELLKKGKAYEAVMLTCYGSLAAVFILILITFPSLILIKRIYPIIKITIPYLLILISLILIFSEKRKFNALKVFLLTGIFGLINSELNITQPLLPMLTGLFGTSTLLMSIKNKTQIPPQEIKNPEIKIKKPLIASTLIAPFCSFLPGLGSGQAALISNMIAKQGKKGFLFLQGTINTIVMGFSFISLYIINRTRTGSALAIKEIINEPPFNIFVLILIVLIISGIISFFITKRITKIFSTKFHKFNYTKLSKGIIIFISLVVLLISGLEGFIILIIATALGVYSINQKVKRTQMMGSLILPTIIWYLI
jgi:putative membrane protein